MLICLFFFFYNRINNDLLLWEPTAPSPVETVENIPYGVGLSVASQLINTYSKDSFSQFRSTGPEGKEHFPFCLLQFLISTAWKSNIKVLMLLALIRARAPGEQGVWSYWNGCFIVLLQSDDGLNMLETRWVSWSEIWNSAGSRNLAVFYIFKPHILKEHSTF